MRLLNKTEVETKQQAEKLKTAQQGLSLAQEVDKVRKQLVVTQDTYRQKEEELNRLHEESVETKRAAIAALDIEIKQRADERETLMRPIDALERKAKQVMDEADRWFVEVCQQSNQNEKKEQELSEQRTTLVEIGIRQEEREEEIKLKERQIKAQEEFNSRSSIELSKKWEEFHAASAQREHDLRLKEAENRNWEHRNAVKEGNLKDEAERLDHERIHIESQQSVLRAAFQEARLKGVI